MKTDALNRGWNMFPFFQTEGPERKNQWDFSNIKEKAFQYLSVFKTKLAIIHVWMERSRQRKELLNMNDHLLKDMGISKTEANQEANKWFWQA